MASIIPSYPNATDPRSPLKIAPITGRIGAVIDDVLVSGDIDQETIQAIEAAVVKHKVVFFRGQHHMTNEDHEEFGAQFGHPGARISGPVAQDSRYLIELDRKEEFAPASWQTDETYLEAPPKSSILRAIAVPEAGGDTLWANTETAYETLPESLRQLANGLRAVHSNEHDHAASFARAQDEEPTRVGIQRSVIASTIHETEHPLVWVHPVSGQRSLVLGRFFKRFVGLTQNESESLFRIFQAHITRPENVVRWRWQPGDVAFSDNRATQHRAVADYGLQRRSLRRFSVEGDTPVGIDGQLSLTLRKERTFSSQHA